MKIIYSRAERVIVWIGEEGSLAMDKIQDWGQVALNHGIKDLASFESMVHRLGVSDNTHRPMSRIKEPFEP